MELSIYCYTALVLEIGCKFGYFIATSIVTVYNTTFFLFLGSSLQISAQYFTFFRSTDESLCNNVTNKFTSNAQYWVGDRLIHSFFHHYVFVFI